MLHYITVTCLLLALFPGQTAWAQTRHTSKSLHPQGAEFQQSLGQVLFSPDGSLYVAYRLRGKNQLSSVLRVVKFDPVRGEALARGDFVVPEVRLPRVGTHFILSQDSEMLAYAELHSPEVLLTIDPAMLTAISSSEARLFAGHDLAPHIKGFNGQSLVLSAERARAGRPITIESVRELALNPANLNQVISDRKLGSEQNSNELRDWIKLSGEDLNMVIPLTEGALAFTNWNTRGWIRLLDQSGKTLVSTEIHDCGPVKAALTFDKEYGVAVCERKDEGNFRQPPEISRKAIVFEVSSLKLLAALPVSSIRIKEAGTDTEEIGFDTPSPAIWRGPAEILVAVPDSDSKIKLHSLRLAEESDREARAR